MIFDSHIEKKISTPSTLGLPRWYKRINYYIFKIRYMQYNKNKLKFLPNYKTRSFIINNYFNELELYNNNGFIFFILFK